MDAITHRHDDVAVPTNSGEVCRRVGREWEAVAPGGIDRARVNARGGVRACGGDRDRTGARPDRCCQLRSGGVLGTDEQDPSRGRHQGRDEVLERLVHQGQVGAAFVGLGAGLGGSTRRVREPAGDGPAGWSSCRARRRVRRARRHPPSAARRPTGGRHPRARCGGTLSAPDRHVGQRSLSQYKLRRQPVVKGRQAVRRLESAGPAIALTSRQSRHFAVARSSVGRGVKLTPSFIGSSSWLQSIHCCPTRCGLSSDDAALRTCPHPVSRSAYWRPVRSC